MARKNKYPTLKQLDDGVVIDCHGDDDAALSELAASHIKLLMFEAYLYDDEADDDEWGIGEDLTGDVYDEAALRHIDEEELTLDIEILARVSAENIERESVLQLAQVEGCRSSQLGSLAVDPLDDLGQVRVELHRRRVPDTGRTGEVAVLAVVEAEAVGREMPVVRAGVVILGAELHRASVLADHQRSLARSNALDAVRLVKFDPVVRRIEEFDHLGVWEHRYSAFD